MVIGAQLHFSFPLFVQSGTQPLCVCVCVCVYMVCVHPCSGLAFMLLNLSGHILTDMPRGMFPR